MKSIGGFLELEQPTMSNGKIFHPKAIPLSSGRSSLSYILKHIKPKKIAIPYYMFHGLAEYLGNKSIPYEFYEINRNLEPSRNFELHRDEYLLYVNYFGLQRKTIGKLLKKYREHLIIDNSHAFFEKAYKYNWSFNSTRKFFGVPDGSYLYFPSSHNHKETPEPNTDYIVDHLFKRLRGETNDGYLAFLKNESLFKFGIKGMSVFTQKLLTQIDYDHVASKRRENFMYLHKKLNHLNRLSFFSDLSECIPFCYPLLLEHEIDKAELFDKNIFFANYWKKCLNASTQNFRWEKELTKKLLPLPIDHRYGKSEMNYILKHLSSVT